MINIILITVLSVLQVLLLIIPSLIVGAFFTLVARKSVPSRDGFIVFFYLGTLMTCQIILMSWVVVLFNFGIVFSDLDIEVLYILGVSSLGVYVISVLKLIYAKVSIQSVLYFSTVVFLSYLVRQFLSVVGIINNFNKKPLHTFFEYAMFIVLVSFSLWLLNDVFNITQQGYVWTVTRIFFVGFFAVCVRSHVVSYFKQNATTIGSILLVVMISVGVLILFPIEVISLLFAEVASLLFGWFVPKVYAAGSEMVPQQVPQQVPERMVLVPVNREISAAAESLRKARMERMIRSTPTSDLLRISGTEYNNRRLREIYGKSLCRLRLSNKDFGSMIKDEFIATIDGRKKIMPQVSIGEMELKLVRRVGGNFDKPITYNKLKAWFENNCDPNMPDNSKSFVRDHYDSMLFSSPVLGDILTPPRVNYQLPTQEYQTGFYLNILLEQVRFTHGNSDAVKQLLAEIRSEYADKSSDLEKELIKSCLESQKGLALDLQRLRKRQASLDERSVLKALVDKTGLAKRDLAKWVEESIKNAHLRYNHYLTLDLLAVIEEKRFALRVSEALNALKPEKSVCNGQQIKLEFSTSNREPFDFSTRVKFLRPSIRPSIRPIIWAPVAQYVETVDEQKWIQRIKTSYEEKTEWHIKNPLPPNSDTVETEGSESSDALTKKRQRFR